MELIDLKNFISQENWSKGITRAKSGPKKEIMDNLYSLTSFLPEDANLAQRAWHVLNDNYELAKCPECGEGLLKWSYNSKNYYGYCSTRCSTKSLKTQEKLKATMQEKYGVDNAMQNNDIKGKFTNTMIEKYGVAHALQKEEFLDKSHNTLLDNYGVTNAMHSDIIKEKLKETNIGKYGVKNPMMVSEIYEKSKVTNLERYGKEYYQQTDEYKERVKITSLEKFGTTHPMKNSKIVDKMKSTNMKKYNVEYNSKIHIPQKTLQILEDKEWLVNKHYIGRLPVVAIAESLNVSECVVKDRFDKFKIELKYFRDSMPEREIREFIEATFNIKADKTKSLIHPYEIDMYIPDHKLAIEFNGLWFHSEAKLEDYKAYHLRKYVLCQEQGVRLIQIFEDEWRDNKDLIKQKISHILGKNDSKKIYARKTSIVEIDTEDKTNFFNRYHIQGNGPSSINYGLDYNNELVACIGFIKNKDGSYYLNRYATSYSVVGGFTKLLTHFEKQFNYPKIITFADLRWSAGELYKNTGFNLDNILKPDYYWTKNGERHHKFNFRHTSGLKKLENYDPELSETVNMHNHGYNRIYDAGKLRFVKNGDK